MKPVSKEQDFVTIHYEEKTNLDVLDYAENTLYLETMNFLGPKVGFKETQEVVRRWKS